MKKMFVSGVLCAFLLAKLAGQNPVVVVAPFEAQGISTEEANIITEIFTSEYSATELAVVVDRDSFDKIKKELSFQASDWSNSNKVAELGRALNANQVVIGKITSFRGQVITTIKVIDINSTTILASHVERANKLDRIFDAFPTICKSLATKANKKGRLAIQNNVLAQSYKKEAYNQHVSYSSSTEKKGSYYFSPVLGFDHFIVAATFLMGLDFKYRHRNGFSFWFNNALDVGVADYSYHENIREPDGRTHYEIRSRTDLSVGWFIELMPGYTKIMGSHHLGFGAGFQAGGGMGAIELGALALRLEYSYLPEEKKVGFITSMTHGFGGIISGGYAFSPYRFSLRLGVLLTPSN